MRQIPGGSFFRGARFDANGNVDPQQRGLYLDKGELVLDAPIRDVVTRYKSDYGVS